MFGNPSYCSKVAAALEFDLLDPRGLAPLSPKIPLSSEQAAVLYKRKFVRFIAIYCFTHNLALNRIFYKTISRISNGHLRSRKEAKTRTIGSSVVWLHKLSAFGFLKHSEEMNTADSCLEISDDVCQTVSSSTSHHLSDSSNIGVAANSRNDQNKQSQPLNKIPEYISRELDNSVA